MKKGAATRGSWVRFIAAAGMLIWAVYTVFITGRLFFVSPLVGLVLNIHPGMTIEEVVAVAGKPKMIYAPDQLQEAYNGWHPKPLITTDHPVWVYEVMASYRVVVYWDNVGRVRCIDVVYT